MITLKPIHAYYRFCAFQAEPHQQCEKKTIMIARPRNSQPIRIQLLQGQTTQAQTVKPNAGQTTQQEVTIQ